MQNKSRLDALDGVRGLAILLVFFNHIDSGFILGALPYKLGTLLTPIFSSGRIGVSLLFILSGFLMAYIYPDVKNDSKFLQKRYTRIFPLFISMSCSMSIFRNFPELSIFYRIPIILSIALFFHLIWVYVVQRKLSNTNISVWIFKSFVSIQILFGIYYALFVMRSPAINFNQLLDPKIREFVIFGVNATLILPLGNYIPMLDGVYWSLASEVLFYILYAGIFTQIISKLRDQNLFVKFLFFVSLFPLLSSITVLSRKLYSLDLVSFPLFIYFATGIALAYLYKKFQNRETTPKSNFKLFTNPVLFFLAIYVTWYFLSITKSVANDWVRMLFSIPLTVCIGLALVQNTQISKFFNSKILVWFGMVSYPIYLTHTSVVDGFHLMFRPINFGQSILFATLAFFTTCSVSLLLHHLLEKPYFIKRVKVVVSPHKLLPLRFKILSLFLFLIFIIGIFLANQSNFNFLSLEKKLDKSIFINPKIDARTSKISIRKSGNVDLRITATESNFGILSADLTYKFEQLKKENTHIPQVLVFQIKPIDSGEWYATSTYSPAEIGDSRNHPFGFPTIVDSKNKTFDVNLFMSNPEASENVYINLEDHTMIAVYQIDKKELIKNPMKLFQILVNRMENVFASPNARVVFMGSIPFFLILIFLSHKKRTNIMESTI